MEKLRLHDEAMAALQEKAEGEGERRGEELNRCMKVIEELQQQLEDSEHGRVEQQQKVMVVNSTSPILYRGGKGRHVPNLPVPPPPPPPKDNKHRNLIVTA